MNSTIILRTLYNFCVNHNFKHPHMYVAREILNNEANSGKNLLRKIKLDVYHYYGFSEEQAEMKNRKRERVEVRQVAMSLCNEFLGERISLSVIGEEIAGMDHSTVIHACKTVKKHNETEVFYKERFDAIRNYIIQKYNLNGSEK